MEKGNVRTGKFKPGTIKEVRPGQAQDDDDDHDIWLEPAEVIGPWKDDPIPTTSQKQGDESENRGGK
jgi:hypothetical protein